MPIHKIRKQAILVPTYPILDEEVLEMAKEIYITFMGYDWPDKASVPSKESIADQSIEAAEIFYNIIDKKYGLIKGKSKK